MRGRPYEPVRRAARDERTTLNRKAIIIVAITAALAAAAPATGGAAGAPCAADYSYAGLVAPSNAAGVAATITPLATPGVLRGHVAGWVGVGGEGYGPQGTTEWLQVGISAFPGAGARIYYEVRQPYWAPVYREVGIDVAPGEPHRLAVLRVAGKRSTWRVWVDGHAVSPAYYLPDSGGWKPEATAESWNDGSGVCNDYSFRFTGLAYAARPGGSWRGLPGGEEFQDPGYLMIRHSPMSFDARSLR